MTGRGVRQRHIPVLLEEVLKGLGIREGGVYLDATVGEGGHSLEILRRSARAQVIGIDQDPEALASAEAALGEFGQRVRLCRRNFRYMGEVVQEMGVPAVDGILLDLGVSSLQLDLSERGFSFSQDGPLDMRMDPDGALTAGMIVNSYSEEDLARIISTYGEERLSRRIAQAIAQERSKNPITTTAGLAVIVSRVPGMSRVKSIHPATRTFQALRIEVNDELNALREALVSGIGLLVPGGRMAVISFHSLEDRIVKRTFRRMADPCECPPDFPMCVCGALPMGSVRTRRPIIPGESERRDNPRSRSARLRIFERAPRA